MALDMGWDNRPTPDEGYQKEQDMKVIGIIAVCGLALYAALRGYVGTAFLILLLGLSALRGD